MQPLTAYPAQLHNLLTPADATQLISVANEGLSGERAAQGVLRLTPSLLAGQPEVLMLFEGFNDMLDWHGEHCEAEISGHEVPDDRRASLKERYRKARDDVRRSIAGQAWLLDPRVTDEIDALWRELHKRRNSMFEELDEGYGAIANSQQKIIAIAKQDLAR